MTRVGRFLLATALTLAAALRAADHIAANVTELAAALAKVQPGDTIILADGTWRDAAINLDRGGAPSAPLRVRAQTPGKVELAGASSLTFSAPHIEVDGLLFKGGALAKGNVVQFNSHHGRLTNSAVIDYNPADTNKGYYWVYFDGDHNRVDRCTFSGKNHHQPVVGNDLTNSRHNMVEYSHFKDIAHNPSNGREIFRIWGYGGNEELGPDGAFFTVANNLFERAHGEGQEIVSLKSNRNVVRNNTIRATKGGITNRSGNYNTIEGNFIFGDGERGAYGMRITGQHHRVLHNYIEGVSYGINLMAGELFLEPLTDKFVPTLREKTVHGRVPRYNQPRYTVIAYNTLVNNSEPDLRIGGDYKSGWPAAQRILLPEFCQIAHNLIGKSAGGGGGAVAVVITPQDKSAPFNKIALGANSFSDNIVSGGKIQAATGANAGVASGAELAGFTTSELKFERTADGTLRPVDATLAQSSAAAAPAVFTQEPSPFRPLTAADVGPEWMRSAGR